MSSDAKLMSAIIMFIFPTIEFGGHFLLRYMQGKYKHLQLTPFQQRMFKSGHSHAGVFTIIALICQLLIDHAGYAESMSWFLRIGFIASAVIISAGFFFGAMGPGRTNTNKWASLIIVAIFLVTTCMLSLGIGLLANR
ncbi:hypothetical protein M3B46_02585 [Sphingobacterium daejeonense]|jgi:hypothetical protein|uniref:hypothetical protein n=1 Tax=Sphingobacterium daejeonense TaxID=371142 RepID=UPI0021A77C8E|nr:hypothetical protein [Sphingobacterium daejeonense]MCT1529864.1 hypothetical protein [Sphingobacterium daejeonense]